MADREHNPVEASRGSFKSYLIGFGLMLVLSAFTFLLAMSRALPKSAAIPIVLVLATAQIAALLIAFLGLNRYSEDGRWTLMIAIYAVVVLAILVSATVWIMYHLNYNMMVNLQ